MSLLYHVVAAFLLTNAFYYFPRLALVAILFVPAFGLFLALWADIDDVGDVQQQHIDAAAASATTFAAAPDFDSDPDPPAPTDVPVRQPRRRMREAVLFTNSLWPLEERPDEE